MNSPISSNHRFFAFVAILAIAGAILGFSLSCLPKLVPYKLLNIVGILSGLLGVVVLSEFVVRSDKAKKFMVLWVAGLVLWTSMVVPLGMLLGTGIAFILGRPSAAATAISSVAFVTFLMLPLAVIDATVFNPIRPNAINLHGRHQVLGIALIVGGCILQLIAAIYDLLT